MSRFGEVADHLRIFRSPVETLVHCLQRVLIDALNARIDVKQARSLGEIHELSSRQ